MVATVLLDFKRRYVVSGYRFDIVMFCQMACSRVIVPFCDVIVIHPSLRINRADLGTKLTKLNMAAMERSTTLRTY